MKKYKVIDFHTHLFLSDGENLCKQKGHISMSIEKTVALFKGLGVVKVCGSVVPLSVKGKEGALLWEETQRANRLALQIADELDGYYIPGFHVNPAFLEESLQEIDFMQERGVRLIGELVPAFMGIDYENGNMKPIIEYATQNNMIFNLHTVHAAVMEKVMDADKNATIICAHPGEGESLDAHLARMKKYENCYIDISGTGINRHGVLRRLIDGVGVERILYGSDYPVCNPASLLGGIILDDLITEREKEYILYKNAKRLLGI